MTIDEARRLLAECESRGLRLEVHGDRVRVSPRSLLTPELQARLLAAKPELLRLLSAPPRCASHLRFTDWIEATAVDRPGWLRTTCRLCGTFIGYRPTRN